MTKYILKRVGYMFFTLWIVATATFFLVNSIPGDPLSSKTEKLTPAAIESLRAKYKLDDPKIVQYGAYMSNLLKGDLGESIQFSGRKVNDMIKNQFPVSAQLGLQSVVLGLIIGVAVGIVAGLNRGKWPDYLVVFLAIMGIAVPSFILSVLLQYYLGGKFGLPVVGWNARGSFFANFKYTVLPTIALTVGGLASNARFMRTSVLDVVGQDYIMTAEAKGVTRIGVMTKHILRNALLPVVTIVGPRIATIITGTIVIEQLFAVPGLGRELVSAINNRDYTVVMSLTVFFCFIYVVCLLLVDIAYVLIDPRMKASITNNK